MEQTTSDSPILANIILATEELDILKEKVEKLEMLSLESDKRLEEQQERIKKEAEESLEQLRLGYQEQVDALKEKNKATLQRVNFLGGRCVKLMIENEKLRTDNHRMSEDLCLLTTCEDGEKAKALVEEEREKTYESHKKMLKAQEQLREQQEKTEGDSKPWRLCQICEEVFSEVPDHSPRILFCGHTFCLSCCQRSAKDKGIECPYCRCFSPVDKERLKEEMIINFALLHM